MKKLFKTSFILLALLGVMFTSCKKEYEIPPIPVLPVGDVYTIGDLLAMPANTSFDTASVYGIVVADEQSGNLYKNIFIQDRKSGKAIELMMNTSSAARIGDSVRVFLDKNIMVNNYHNLPQLVGKDGKGFSPDGHLIIYPYNKPIEPATVTIADIKTGNYTAAVVRLENVEFTEQGSAFCNVGENTNRTLKDATGELLVRTSNYANFAYDLLPVGKGSLVAIASVYNNDWQLIIRSKNEMQFEGGEPTPPSPPGEVQHLPYTQSFSTEFGTYMTYDVMGDQGWVIDYNTAKITGYVNSAYYANEDWLISSPVDLSGVSEVTMSMTYIGRYFTNINEEVTFWASTDYTYGNDPTTATWTPIPARLSEGSNWTDFLTTDIDLSSFAGQTVTVAVKYISSDVKAGTMEIQTITIKEKGDVPPGPQPGGEVQSMPYYQSFETEFGTYTTFDVMGAESWMIDFKTAKMTGYVNPNYYANEDWLISSPVAVTGVNDAKMTMEYIGRYFSSINSEVTIWGSTDYVFGSDPTTANWRQVPATLTEGNNWNDFLTVEIGLSDFVGQTATFAVKYTSTDSKAGTMEIKSITIEEGSGVTPPTPPTPGGEVQNIPYYQSFASEFGSYTTKDVQGAQSWMIDFQTAKMTGYVNPNYYANEDWLISSPVNLTGVNEAKLTMEYICRYFNSVNDEITIWGSTDYTFGNDPSTATWSQIPSTLEESSNWTDFKTAEISLMDVTGQPFAGRTATFAVKYTSTDNKAGTIEVKSITIEEGSGVTPPTPPTPGPGTGSGTAEDPYNVASGISLQNEEPIAWVQGYIVGSVKNGTSTVSGNSDVLWNAPFDSPTNVVIADDPTCNDIDLCIFVNLPVGKPLRTQVNLADHPDNLGKQLAVHGKLRKYFGKAGLRDSNGTVNDFVLEGGTPTPPPTPGGEVQDLPYSQSFATDFGTYTTYNVAGEQEWMIDYQTAKMTGFVNPNSYANEDWLISSPFNIPMNGVPTLTIEYIGRFFDNINEDVTFWISGDYEFGSDPTTATWLQMPAQLVTSSNWNDFQTAQVDMSIIGQLMGSATATIAVKYISTNQASGTIEIKSLTIE